MDQYDLLSSSDYKPNTSLLKMKKKEETAIVILFPA